MNNGQEIIEYPQQGGSIASDILAAGGAMQQVRSSFCTAVTVQKPRDIGSVRQKLIAEARLMGEDAYYGWGAGKNAIEGPSIDLAVAAARCWGNCATDMLPVQDLPDAWIFTAAFIDLETGYTRTRQFRQAKGHQVHGKMDDERKMDMRFQIGQSKAERNVILKALPSWLINAALDAAKEGVRQELENLTKKHGHVFVADRLVNALIKCGIKEAAILKKCQVAERKGLTVDHLVILRGDLNAIQSGQERAEVLFPTVVETTQHEPNQSDQQTTQTTTATEQTGPATQEPREEEKPKKALKKTVKVIYQLAQDLGLTPIEKHQLCEQRGVESFEEFSEDAAQAIIADLEDAKRRGQEQPQRDPGDDGDDGN